MIEVAALMSNAEKHGDARAKGKIAEIQTSFSEVFELGRSEIHCGLSQFLWSAI